MSNQWPVATRADHQRFCEVEGWEQVRDALGRTGTHHFTYELALPDGRRLRTRVSHPADRTDYGQRLWSHILRDQLAVDAEAFWACVRDGVVPDRGERRAPPELPPIPAGVVAVLLREVGLSDAEVAAMSRDQAIARVNEYWTGGA